MAKKLTEAVVAVRAVSQELDADDGSDTEKFATALEEVAKATRAATDFISRLRMKGIEAVADDQTELSNTLRLVKAFSAEVAGGGRVAAARALQATKIRGRAVLYPFKTALRELVAGFFTWLNGALEQYYDLIQSDGGAPTESAEAPASDTTPAPAPRKKKRHARH